MRTVIIEATGIRQTVEHLQQAGREHKECVVLWLAGDEARTLHVQAVFKPEQTARADIFRIPPSAMRDLISTLRSRQLIIAAQVHSHPAAAFHSPADDAWAIVRHVGALSLVLPDFGLRTDEPSFMTDMRLYRLDETNRWLEVPDAEVAKCLRIA